ncbi:MAG: L-2-hydroxyglutarate oxidase [Bacteroidetes bacterium]|nr:MAG: L-2-hydroxyglutarate oxidase [Bacteroidota bacterium]
MKQCDVAVIGGGIVGLATAWQLAQKAPDLKICVLEKEAEVAAHQSSHNSGVIHSGIYYRPGSLKATNCREGWRRLIAFCDKYEVPYELCGKIIVATNEAERPYLHTIFERGRANGLEGIRLISGDEARAYEPHVAAVEAIHVPQAGIISFGRVARKYAELLERQGGEVLLRHAVIGLAPSGKRRVVQTTGGEVEARLVVNCAGLHADRVAAMAGARTEVQVVPFRGEYYELKPEREHLVRNLIYPVPNPKFPFLGVHFTRMIEGGIEAGPNAVLAFAREGYKLTDVRVADLAEALAFPGFWKMLGRFWRESIDELHRSASKRAFIRALQKLVPEVQPDDFVKGRSGVRAQCIDRHGKLVDDFLFVRQPGYVHVLNAPSPAATSSLAIGDRVAGIVLESLDN